MSKSMRHDGAITSPLGTAIACIFPLSCFPWLGSSGVRPLSPREREREAERNDCWIILGLAHK